MDILFGVDFSHAFFEKQIKETLKPGWCLVCSLVQNCLGILADIHQIYLKTQTLKTLAVRTCWLVFKVLRSSQKHIILWALHLLWSHSSTPAGDKLNRTGACPGCWEAGDTHDGSLAHHSADIHRQPTIHAHIWYQGELSHHLTPGACLGMPETGGDQHY